MNDKFLEGPVSGRQLVGILLGVTFLALLIGLGSCAYSAGLAQGLGQGGTVIQAAPAVPAPGVAPAPYPYYVGRGFGQPFGFGGFLGCLVPFFVILFGFALLRGLFWRRHWGSGSGMRHGFGAGEAPPMFDEWHRRAHAEPEAGTRGPAGQGQGGPGQAEGGSAGAGSTGGAY